MTEPNPDVLINFVLDRSGSMNSQVAGTIDGFNTFMDEQREQAGEARLSLTLFDGQFETPFIATPLADVPALGTPGNPFQPRGNTALLDAVGLSVKGAEGWLANHPEFGGQVITVILTDGMENGSRQWHIRQPMVAGDDKDLAGLIQYKQAEGWQFVFLGAGGADWLERTFGHVVAPSQFLSYAASDAGHSSAYRGISRQMTNSRVAGAAMTVASALEPEPVPA